MEIDERDTALQVVLASQAVEREHAARVRCQLQNVIAIRILEQHGVRELRKHGIPIGLAQGTTAKPADNQGDHNAGDGADNDENRSRHHGVVKNDLGMLGYRVLLGEVHDSPIVLVEAHRGEERRLAVALSDGQGGNVAVVLYVLLHLVYDRVRIPLAAQHVVQVGAIVELRLLEVDDNGAVALHEHGTQQRHRRLDLGGIDEGVRIHDAAKHAHNHVVLHHRFGDAVEVAVQPVGLAHVRHDALAGFEPSQDLAIAFLSIRIVNALFERGDGNVGHPEGRSLVPRVQKISEHLAFGVDIGRFCQRPNGEHGVANLADG